CLNEIPLGRGVHVQAVGNSIRLDEVDQRPFHARIVVTEVQYARAGKKIDEAATILVDLAGVGGAGKDGGKGMAIGANARLPGFERFKGLERCGGVESFGSHWGAPGQVT